MIYLVTFFNSIILTYIAERRGNKRFRFLIFTGLALLILLATFRDESVGIDVRGYVKPLYLFACQYNSIFDFIVASRSDVIVKELEIGFSLFGYIGAKLFSSLNGMFLVYETINVFTIYWAYKVYTKACSVSCDIKVEFWLVLLCYVSQFYNMSLTMMRQSSACAIVVLAVAFLVNNRYFLSLFTIIIASLFHSTALFGTVFIGLYWLVKNKKRGLLKAIHIFEVFLFLFSGRLYWIIMTILNRFIPIPPRYMSYTYMWQNGGKGVNLAWIFIIGITLFIAIMNLVKLKNDLTLFELNIVFLAISIFPLGIQAANAGRIEYYMMYLFIFILPKAKLSLKNIKFGNYRLLSTSFVLLINIIYWLGTVGFNDYTGTMPYTFSGF